MVLLVIGAFPTRGIKENILFDMFIKTQEDIDAIREGGHLLARIVEELSGEVQPGVSTWELDKMAEQKILSVGGTPAFKGYRGGKKDPPFPGTICASIDDEVVHGIPRKDRFLQKGNLFKLDIGMRYKDRYTDMARTFAVGKVSHEAQQLLDVTRESLEIGARTIREGSTSKQYASAVQKYIESFGYEGVRDLVGHGVGYEVHEPPQIPNYVDAQMVDFVFRKGMVIALEPMVNMGVWRVNLSLDGWTFKTADGSLSAHFENTYTVLKEGVEQLTRI